MSDTSFFIKTKDNFLSQQEFTQISVISNSGFNSLYRAKRNGKWWLLKCLKKELQGDVMYQSLLKKEFDLMTSLQHPYIVQLYSIEDVKGIGIAIVMEWIEGVTLDKWLATPHSLEERRNVTSMLIDALNYVHSLQIQHRDLKPQNIMVVRGGAYIKLIDFGLSDSNGYAVLKQAVGSEGYVAPEGPDDIFSLGCLLKDLKTGGFASLVVKRCCGVKHKRYGSIDVVKQNLNLCWRLPKYIFVIVFVAVAFALSYFVNIESSRQSILPKVEAVEQSVIESMEQEKTSERLIYSIICALKSKIDSIVKVNGYENDVLYFDDVALVAPITDQLLDTLKTDIKNLPTEVNDVERSNIYNQVSIHIMDNYNMRWINDITNRVLQNIHK